MACLDQSPPVAHHLPPQEGGRTIKPDEIHLAPRDPVELGLQRQFFGQGQFRIFRDDPDVDVAVASLRTLAVEPNSMASRSGGPLRRRPR